MELEVATKHHEDEVICDDHGGDTSEASAEPSTEPTLRRSERVRQAPNQSKCC